MTPRETITFDAHPQQRLLVLPHVLAGELTLDEASAYLRLSTRQGAPARREAARAGCRGARPRQPRPAAGEPGGGRGRRAGGGACPDHLCRLQPGPPRRVPGSGSGGAARPLASDRPADPRRRGRHAAVATPRTRRTSRGHPRERRARRGRIGRERRARRGRGSTNGPAARGSTNRPAARGLEAWTGVDPGSDTPPLLLLRGLQLTAGVGPTNHVCGPVSGPPGRFRRLIGPICCVTGSKRAQELDRGRFGRLGARRRPDLVHPAQRFGGVAAAIGRPARLVRGSRLRVRRRCRMTRKAPRRTPPA
jgi:hypothetical protein